MKKLICLTLAVLMIFSLVACGGDNGSQGSGLIKVGIINNNPNESGYRTANDKAMREMFTTANGYEATFYNDNDAAQQIATAQQMIQDEVDYLLLSPRLHHRLGHRPG